MLLFQALLDSYSEQLVQWRSRVDAGFQPDLPGTSWQFLVSANIFYLGVTFALYKYMGYRGVPFKCKSFKSILLLYNFTCVVLAGYVVWGIMYSARSVQRNFVCNRTVIPGQGDDDGHAGFLAHVFWVFFAQKFWEFLDTWFFLLRMSFRQVTFLHVFHHCSINIVVGLILPFDFNGDMYLPILLNAFVHVLMYSHYLVSAIGLPTPWKPYLTSMQLVQFCLIAVQSAVSLHHGSRCGAPYFAKVIMVTYMMSMLVLFGHFFLKSYVMNKPSTSLRGVMKRPEPVQVTRTHCGRVTLDSAGVADIAVPTSFKGELVYQLTPIGAPMPSLHVSREPDSESSSFALAGGVPDRQVSWNITMIQMLFPESTPKPHICCNVPDNNQDADGQSCCHIPLPSKKAQ